MHKPNYFLHFRTCTDITIIILYAVLFSDGGVEKQQTTREEENCFCYVLQLNKSDAKIHLGIIFEGAKHILKIYLLNTLNNEMSKNVFLLTSVHKKR